VHIFCEYLNRGSQPYDKCFKGGKEASFRTTFHRNFTLETFKMVSLAEEGEMNRKGDFQLPK
jgi:hypothetical protein